MSGIELKPVADKTEEHWLELADEDGWYRISVKWDGCIEFRKAYNQPFPQERDDTAQIHICDLDEHIALLQKIRDEARLHFGDDWK